MKLSSHSVIPGPRSSNLFFNPESAIPVDSRYHKHMVEAGSYAWVVKQAMVYRLRSVMAAEK